MKRSIKRLTLVIALLTCVSFQANAQEDPLQDYLDQIAAEQAKQKPPSRIRRAKSVEIPIGLTEVDLRKFTSYTSRNKELNIKANVKFTHGTIAATSDFSGGTSLLKVHGGVTVVLDSTAAVDASATNSTNCIHSIGIYGGSTFYQCGNITAPDNGIGVAVYLDTSADTYIYVSGTTKSKISNPNNGTIIGLDVKTYTKEELKTRLDSLGQELNTLNAYYKQADSTFASLQGCISSDVQTQVSNNMSSAKTTLNGLNNTKTSIDSQLETAAESSYEDINEQIDALASSITDFKNKMTDVVANCIGMVKASAATKLQSRLNTIGNDISSQRVALDKLKHDLYQMSTGSNFFERKSNQDFDAAKTDMTARLNEIADRLNWVASEYNTFISSASISSVDDIARLNLKLDTLDRNIPDLQTSLSYCQFRINELNTQYNTLEVNFPTEGQVYDIAPTGITNAVQLGYKSNRGFVLTSSGMMYFEQVKGADFRLRNQDNQYVVAKKGSSKLTAGTKETATVWTGISLGNGSYTFYSNDAQQYITCNNSSVNSTVYGGTALQWTIKESDLDELQAFLNLLAEEDGTTTEKDPSVSAKDTLVIYVPRCGCAYINPIALPVTPYPVIVRMHPGQSLPIPRPTPGTRTPASFHPYYVPKDSHVILDSVAIQDLIGGDHVIYVEGTIEININVTFNIENWDWFIHVGPGGRVIWHPLQPGTGAWPRLITDKDGTVEMDDDNGFIGYIENHGTVNHKKGTIYRVINRYVYYFTGGIINYMHNYGTQNHNGGTIAKVLNDTGGTYNMTGGHIENNVQTVIDTVFVNCGTFNFTGGYICGYGSRLIYHAKGAKMRIDGGMFCFDHVHDYWIEAHDDFYIRGDYDYEPTRPILLSPSVSIRILYNWTYKFNITFIGGRPTPRYPLFYGPDGYRLSNDFFKYIIWDLPNSRWRWYYKENTNSIEPRDEEVQDEDDLQAYLDWLAAHQNDDAASTEEKPQELDLKEYVIVITKPVRLPVGAHIYIKNGQIMPQGTWTNDYVFYIPGNSSLRFENTVIDYSSSTYYIVNNVVVQRYIFDVIGNLYFGTGCHIIGYLDPNEQYSDSFIPGSVIRIDPSAHIYLSGGRFDNIVFRLNKVVNIYVTAAITNGIRLYVPSAFRTRAFRLLAPYSSYSLTTSDLQNILLTGFSGWGTETDSEGYAILSDTATGISAISGSQEAGGKYYNLGGQQVQKPKRGLYIKDGKKIIVK